MFVAEGFIRAVGWVDLALKDPFAFVSAVSGHLLTLLLGKFPQRREGTKTY